MSVFKAETSLGTLWRNERRPIQPFLEATIAQQLSLSESRHDLLSHSLHVRNLAYYIALQVNDNFPNLVDPDLVATSGIFHDHGKVLQQPDINTPYPHFIRSQFHLANSGYPGIGSLAGRHNFGTLIRDKEIPLEQMILIYVDVRSRTLKDSNPVVRYYETLDNAFPEIRNNMLKAGRLGVEEIDKGYSRLKQFEETLRNFGINIDDLSELPERFTPFNRQYYNPPKSEVSEKSEIGAIAEFESSLSKLGIVSLSQEIKDKAVFIRSTIKDAVNGRREAAEILALIDPLLTDRWIELLAYESKSRARREIKKSKYSMSLEDQRNLYAARVADIETFEELKDENYFRKSKFLSKLKKIFTYQDSANDSVAFHAAEVFGKILSKISQEDKLSAFGAILKEFLGDTENSYIPIVLRELLKNDQQIAEIIIRGLAEVSITSIGQHGLDMFAEALNKLDSVDALNDILNEELGFIHPKNRENGNIQSKFSYAHIFSRLLNSESREIRIAASQGLINLHQRGENDTAFKLYIEGLYDPDKKHDIEDLQLIIDRLNISSDELEIRALCNVLGKVNFGENKEEIGNVAGALLRVLKESKDNEIIYTVLQNLGREGLAPYLTTDQLTDVLKELWQEFYFNADVRALMPYFLAEVYAIRTDFPHMEEDLNYFSGILKSENHPDRHLQYEIGKFFIGLVSSISDNDDWRIKFSQQNILETGVTNPKLFDMLFYKYASKIIFSPYLDSSIKSERLMGNMIRKYISSEIGDPVIRYKTYKLIIESGLKNALFSKNAVFFNGTFDPFHEGSETQAVLASELIGDVFIQADDLNPNKQPRPRSVRNEIIRRSIAEQMGLFLFNDPQQFDFRSPQEFSELRRIFKDRELWLLIGEDRLRTSKYYENFEHYVYQVPHVFSIRSSNFKPCKIEFRNGKVVGEVEPELLAYLQSQIDLYDKIMKFSRIVVIGSPVNFSSTAIKTSISQGVLRAADKSALSVIATYYADRSLIDHVSARMSLNSPREFDIKRQDGKLWIMPEKFKEEAWNILKQKNTSRLPLIENCQAYYDPLTGYGYLVYMSAPSGSTIKILKTFDFKKSHIFGSHRRN